MNYSRAIFLISDEVRGVLVTYEEGDKAKKTLYKTFDTAISPGDYVVVPTDTRHLMTVCLVTDVDVEPDVEAATDIDWIIGTVDRANFEDIKAQEAQAIATIRSAEKKRKRRELQESLLAGAEEEIQALPIASLKKIADKE